MAERLLPGALWKPISYRLDAPKFPAPPLGYIVHVPVSNGSLFNYFNGLRSPGRKFCTAWIPKKGHGKPEQYQSLDRQSWAQADGNPLYWSFEVEGFPTEPMDDYQLDTLATWHRFLDVDDAIATKPGQRGIGTHSMGGKAWGGHSCPGAIRTAQLPQILDRLKGDDMTPDDVKKAVLDALLAYRRPNSILGVPDADDLNYLVKRQSNIASLIRAVNDPGALADALAPRLAAALPSSTPTVTDEQLRSALRDVLGSVDEVPTKEN